MDFCLNQEIKPWDETRSWKRSYPMNHLTTGVCFMSPNGVGCILLNWFIFSFEWMRTCCWAILLSVYIPRRAWNARIVRNTIRHDIKVFRWSPHNRRWQGLLFRSLSPIFCIRSILIHCKIQNEHEKCPCPPSWMGPVEGLHISLLILHLTLLAQCQIWNEHRNVQLLFDWSS